LHSPTYSRTRGFTACLVIVLGLLALGARGQNASNGFWQAQSIYQIITDRFFDGNPANDNAEGTYSPSNPTGVHGGDFQGIEQKLDYIKSLGATAIWISPVVLNTEGQFHGYSAWNFYQVAPHWGTLSNLQHMVQAAHARGLLVIQDMVVNHAGDLVTGTGSGYPAFIYPPGGYGLKYVSNSKTYPTPFNLTVTNASLTNFFHNYGNIANFNDSTQVVLGQLDGLNDFRTETTYVRTQMAAIYQSWIGQAGFDAFRIDTVFEVEMGFWQNWCPAIHAYAATNGNPNFFMFGEVYVGSDTTVGSYTGTQGGGPYKLDSTLDYPLYFTVNSVFANATGDTQQIENHYHAVDSDYDPTAQMRLVTFLDNHDLPRFMSSANANGNTNRLEVALAFLYTARGIPSLYYGTEQGFDGGNDPNNREDMFAGQFKDGPSGVDSFDMTNPLFRWVAQMNNFRRLYPALQLGTHVNQWNDPSGPGLFAYSRVLGTEEVFVVFNTATTNQTLPGRPLTYASGTVLANLLDTNDTITVLAGSQSPSLTVPGTAAKIYIAQSLLQPLDPVVVSSSPAHAATNIQTFSPVVLQFSKPMNTNSVQSAFGTVPPVSGTFGWSGAGSTLTFTPTGAGLAPLTNILVFVTNTARDALSGKTLSGTYSLQFMTTTSSIPGVVQFSSPATNGTVVPLGSNTTYLIQACFTPTLDTNDATLFRLTINGAPQPQGNYILRPPGGVPGCPGMRSFLYYWGQTSPGTSTGTNVLQLVYSNSVTGVVLDDSKNAIVPPPLVISGLISNQQWVVWSSTPGASYRVLATTNLGQAFVPVSPVITANGLSTSFYDVSNSPPVPQKFYQIEQVP